MFTVQPNKFVTSSLSIAVSEKSFNDAGIQHFDNDGFQLNELEQEYYLATGIQIESCLGVWAAHYPWITCEPGNNFVIDHSLILSRCHYSGRAREQLEQYAGRYPQLRKYLLLKPKWGIDFALEYYTEDDYIEVLHIEQDYDNYEQAQRAKESIEQRIIHTDWLDFTRNILARKHEWLHLQGMARNDWKARYWGLDRAEHTLKAF